MSAWTMVTLSLFRHAKSSWAGTGLRDFERPLAPRGKDAAPKMGAFMNAQELVPDLVLCSPAARAMETLEYALPELGDTPEIRYEEGLYHAGPRQMLQFLNDVDAGVGHVMLIGHNPGMQGLALGLVGLGEADELVRALSQCRDLAVHPAEHLGAVATGLRCGQDRLRDLIFG